jgi:hypothetical protein
MEKPANIRNMSVIAHGMFTPKITFSLPHYTI